jgi:hypothetical protein
MGIRPSVLQLVLPDIAPCAPGASTDLSICDVGMLRRPLLPLVSVPVRPAPVWWALGLARSNANGGAHPDW